MSKMTKAMLFLAAIALAPLGGLLIQSATGAPQKVIQQSVAVCNPWFPTQCSQPDSNGALPVVTSGGLPANSTPITASATGTTAATAATLTGTSGQTTYICGFSIRANATAAATANSTVAGTVSGTMNYVQWTAPLARGLGITEQIFQPCIPASAANTSIVVTSAAPGAGGTVSVSAWGYRQ